MRKVALSFFILVSAFLFSSVSEVGAPGIAHATSPSLSGAGTMCVPNGDFTGDALGTVGTPPTNNGFETAGGSVGTPPSNYDFASGLTGWSTTGGTPTVLTGGPTGDYLELGTSDKLLSSAFTVDSNAEVMSFDIAAPSGQTYNIAVDIKYGASYASTSTKTLSCSSGCTTWATKEIDAVAWRGQSIKYELRRVTGTGLLDNVGAMTQRLPNWTPADGTTVSRSTGGPGGAYASVSKSITSAAFTVDAQAQNGQVDLKIDSGSGAYSIKVLSGGSYATSTTVYAGSSGDTSWGTRSFGLGNYAGQSVKLQIVPDTGTAVSVDGAGVGSHVLGGWTAAGIGNLVVDSATAFPTVTVNADVQSQSFSQDGYDYNGSNRGNWYRIQYVMRSNFYANGTDIGSTLNVYVPGRVSPVFTAAGNSAGSPYDPVDVMLEKYFFVIGDPAHVTTPTPINASFTIKGWPPVPTNPAPGSDYDGPPGVSVIEMVDGPCATMPVTDPGPAAVAPPGTKPEQDVQIDTTDPVSVVTGNYSQTKTDLAIPGKGIPLVWTRSYSANAKMNGLGVTGAMGAKWSHNWQASLSSFDSTHAIVYLPAGGKLMFNKISSTWYGPTGWEGTLVKNGGGDWTLTTGNQLVYAFNSSGQWTSVTDRNGNVTTLTYSSGKLTTIADPGSRTLAISYDGNDRIDEVSDGTRSVLYGYNGGGDLTSITDVMGSTITYAYSNHRLTQGTDAEGHVFVRNTYDALGRVTQQLDANSGTTTIAYDTPGAGATRVTDQRSKQTTYYFDTKYRITDVEDHDGGVTTTAWDSNNNKTSVTNALGKVWSYTYDSHHNVLTATDPLSKVWTYTYNGRNDVVTVTDPLSKLTTYGYDSDGNLTTVTDHDSRVTTFTVNGDGLVTAVTDPLSHATSFGYDSYGNRTTVTNAYSKVWTYTYDGFGRVTAVNDPLSHGPTFTYNAANLVLTATDELSNVTTYTYDDNGNVLTVTDAKSNVTTYVYNNRDQPTSITDDLTGVWSFTYDAAGNLLTKTNPRGKVTTYTYDNLSRLKTESDPLSKVRTYNYDIGGRLSSRVDPKSQQIDYTYNDRNELTRIDYPGPGYVSFAYGDSGARSQMVDSTGTTSYSYDNIYRLTSVTFPGSRVVSYGYDDVGRRTSITYPGGTNQVTYGYDNANRLTSVTDWNSQATTYSYDDAGRMTTATLPSGTGIVSTYSYDNADRLTSIAHVKGGNTTVASVAYTLDAVGNRTQRVDQQGTHTYVYDDLHRLTSVTYPGPSTTTYAFDAFGNRTSKVDGSGTTTYSYDNADRLGTVTPPSPAPAVSYTWDDNGNLTDRGSDSFSWDYEDRMTSATVNSVTTNFTYRGDGLRDSRAVSGGATTTFTWDIASGLLAVLDDGNQYVYGAGLTSMKQSGNWYYYLADGLGSTMAIVDSSGNSQKSYQYDVYGEVTGGSGSLSNEFDFGGQQTDGTGLQYLRARYYDPETGVFLSREPLSVGPAWVGNPYGYAASDPVSRYDPTGLRPCDTDECGPGVRVEWGSAGSTEAPPEEAWPGLSSCHGGPLLSAPCLGAPEVDEAWVDDQVLDILPIIGEYVTVSRTSHPDAPRKVTGLTDEALEQILNRTYGSSAGRGVSTKAIVDALRNPKAVVRKVDELGRVSFQFRGKDATVVLNQAGEVVTTWAKGTRGMRFPPK